MEIHGGLKYVLSTFFVLKHVSCFKSTYTYINYLLLRKYKWFTNQKSLNIAYVEIRQKILGENN